MAIDIIFLVLMILAVFKGISKGFIVAVFSLVAYIVGLATALKLSATVATYLHNKMHISGYWLPVLSFAIVFIAFALLIKWVASLIKSAVRLVFLGWADTLAGIVLYAVIYTMIFSVILFFANRMHLVTPDLRAASKTYYFVEPFGPGVMSMAGKVFPFFSHLFSDLTNFFKGVSQKA